MPKKLWLLDVDGTLAERNQLTVLPGVQDWVNTLNPEENVFALVTNQGGEVGLRYWMEKNGFGEPGKLMSLEQSTARLQTLVTTIFGGKYSCKICASYRFLSSKGNWSPTPFDPADGSAVDENTLPLPWRKDRRKPSPWLLFDAMNEYLGLFSDVAMIGDSDTDREAAEAADVSYYDADEFFAKVVTITVGRDYPISWLSTWARVGLDVYATCLRYEKMLLSVVERYYRMRARVLWVDGYQAEQFDCDSETANDFRSSIENEWINRCWLVYSDAKTHIDSLWAGRHVEQLVIVYSELVSVYGRDAAKAVEAHLETIRKLYHDQYEFVLGAGPLRPGPVTLDLGDRPQANPQGPAIRRQAYWRKLAKRYAKAKAKGNKSAKDLEAIAELESKMAQLVVELFGETTK